ncbi:MAG TPA: HAD-IA family hydrolase [Planctomycetota bacterium]|nr:HAD-IA family hydrolase [Planctomycetota bacterium]
MIDWRSVRGLSFDCFGTLVDWEAGILRDLKAGLTSRFGKEIDSLISDEELLRLYSQAEPSAQSVAYRPYKEILKTTLARVAESAHFKVRDLEALRNGLPTWPVFAETPDALRRLGAKFRLAVISNCDRDLFEATAPKLGAPLAFTVLAEDVQAYKPSQKPFVEALARWEALGVPKEATVHVSASRFHDVDPAAALGLRTVLVERKSVRHGGATPSAKTAAQPDLVVPTLAALVDAVDA